MLTTLIITIFKTTAIQLAGLFGIFFVFGFVLNELQKWTQTNYRRAFGWAGILFTAWFGTPIHELGHVFFAKLFRHKIDHISLFEPNETTGGLGHVEHSYNKNSLYQKIGNFFIGSAPMIFGGIILAIMLYFLVPDGKEAITPLLQATSTANYLEAIKTMFLTLFSINNLTYWPFWIVLYLSFCAVSHLSPSEQDRRGMWQGFGWIVFILLSVNMILVLMQFDATNYILKASFHWLNIFIGIFIFAICIAIAHFLLSLLLRFVTLYRFHHF